MSERDDCGCSASAETGEGGMTTDNPLDGMPRLHERYRPVALAQDEIRSAFWKAVARHDLTFGEVVDLIGRLASDTGQMMVREERKTAPEAADDD